MRTTNESVARSSDDLRADLYRAYALLLSDESRFMRIARRYRLVTRGDVSERLSGWVAREVDHEVARDTVRPALEARGLRVRLVQTMLRLLHDWIFTRLLKLRWMLLGLVGVEHFKVMMAQIVLSDPERLEGVEPPVAGMLRRHFVEVIEHRAVLHDVAAFMGVGYMARVLTGALAMVVYTTSLLSLTAWLSVQRGGPLRLSTYVIAFRFLFVDENFCGRFVRHGLAYLRPGFHPLDGAEAPRPAVSLV
ncbi:MAG: metal-dependent hydrolase [Myxococcota bacterium]